MRNFLKFADIDVIPLTISVFRNESLFGKNPIREEEKGTPHKDTQSIILRFNRTAPVEEIIDDKECYDYPEYARLPEAREIVNWMMARLHCERLGRVVIVRLQDGGVVDRHTDRPALCSYYTRFHIPLYSRPGCTFRCGDEEVEMMPGEVWWFDAKKPHEVVNNSGDDRIHLIIDMRLPGFMENDSD